MIYALIEIGDASAIQNALASFEGKIPATVQHVAVLALAELNVASLKKTVVDLARSSNPLLQNSGWSILARRPDWGGEMAGYFRSRFDEGSPVAFARLRPLVGQPKVLREIHKALGDSDSKKATLQTQLLDVLIDAKPKLSPEWQSIPLPTAGYAESTSEICGHQMDQDGTSIDQR